jgi:hypothetical protein
MSILDTFEKGYKAGKCSFRTTVDEGIPGKVYEVINGNNNS